MFLLFLSYVVIGSDGMKSGWKIILKLGFIGLLFFVSPFYDVLCEELSQTNIKELAYKNKEITPSLSIKDGLNVMSYEKNQNLHEDTLNVETTQENEVVVPQPKEEVKVDDTKKQKSIYIYDTHQGEQYSDGKGVMDAAASLGKKLEEKGYKVVLETHDFEKYLSDNGMDYNSSYLASNKFLQDTLVNYGGFDLIIDLHRDSIPRSVSVIEVDQKVYAKSMCVVGGLNKNAADVEKMSSTLTDMMNTKVNGIMKSPMVREAYYNQAVTDHMLLIEVGSEETSFEEVTNTTNVLAESIDKLLNGG